MISTVTTTAVSTVVSAGMAGVLGVVTVLTLIAFLVIKQLASAGPNRRPQTLARVLSVPIFPLMLAFAVIVTVKVVELL